MDRQIQPAQQNKKKALKWLWFLLIIGAIASAIYYFRNAFRPKASASQIVLTTVQQGNLENTISASGIIKPSSELLVTSPLSSKIQSVKMNDGQKVKAGSIIMNLDTEFAKLEYSKLQDQLKVKENNVERLQLNLEKNIRDIEIDNEIKNMQLKTLQAQLKDAQRLKEIGGGTVEDIERVEQAIQIAQLEKRKLENELNYRKASLRSDVKNEELESSIQQKILNELGKKIELTAVKAPVSGVITWMNNKIGTSIAEGDPLIRIAQLNNFTIEGTVSDIHSSKIKVGLPVQIKINKEKLRGHIEQILPSVANGTVKFRVKLENPNAKSLKANMRVELAIVEGKKENTVYMSNGRAYKGGKSQEFFVLEGGNLIRRELEIGLTNTKNIEILSGAKPGDQILISNMERYEDHDMIPYIQDKDN